MSRIPRIYERPTRFGEEPYGEAYYVQARYPLSFYTRTDSITVAEAIAYGHPDDTAIVLSKNPYFYAVKHALERLDSIHGSNGSFFSGFDNWSLRQGNQDFVHSPVPDGRVDFVIPIYRTKNAFGNPSLSGFDKLWIPENDKDSSFTVTGNAGNLEVWYNAGSSLLYGRRYPVRLMDIMYHEVGHHLFDGNDHQYDGGVWSTMGEHNVSPSSMMNSLERFRLGWINYTLVHVSSDSVAPFDTIFLLRDFAKFNEAIMITDTTCDTCEALLLENHRQNHQGLIRRLPWGYRDYDSLQDVHTYDVVDRSHAGSGLYILAYRPYTNSPQGLLRVVNGDGRWKWEDLGPYTTSCCGVQRLWKRDFAYRWTWRGRRPIGSGFGQCDTCAPINTGATDREGLQWIANNGKLKQEFIWAHIDPQTLSAIDLSPSSLSWGHGDDNWNPEGPNIFSPWSNPNTATMWNVAMPIGFEVLPPDSSDDTAVVKVHVYGGISSNGQPNILSARPSRPQNVRLTLDTVGVTLVWRATWDANIEPDVVNGGKYEVWYRATTTDHQSGTGWLLLDTLSSADTTTLVGQFGVGEGDTYYLEVRVRAADSTNDSTSLLSTFSEIVGGELFWVMPKRREDPADHTPVRESAVKLFVQRDHTLNIIHDAPKGASVKLSIVDMLGHQCLEQTLSPGRGGVAVENLYLPFLPAGRYVVRIGIGENEFHDAVIALR